MAGSRLSFALERCGLTLPDGRMRVLRPDAAYDLGALDQARVEISHGFLPDLAAWRGRGYQEAGPGSVPIALVVAPRSKSHARAMVLQALDQASELVVVDGHKTDGIDSLFKACKPWADIAGSVTKAHGRLFWFAPGQRPDWDIPRHEVAGLATQPGVFSEDRVDRGSRLLAEALPALSGSVADLGAGWGYLSRAILSSDQVTRLDMVEAEKLAVDCLKRNITDARAVAHWADATVFEGVPYDAVVMNPPFHTGRMGAPELGQAFITRSARLLKPNGHLFMVANRHLPYEAALHSLFGKVEEFGGDGGFKLLKAARPKR